MINQKLKLWTGIGVATLLASSVAIADQHGDQHHDEIMTSGSHGGEGGEHHGGEGGEHHESEKGATQGGEKGEHHGGKGEESPGGERGEDHGGEGGEQHGDGAGEAFSYFSAGGEGGEGGEGGGSVSAVESDGAYVAMLQMMQGHLMAARELIKSGDVAEGRPHLTHPWVEVYPMADEGLESRGQKALGNHLRVLAERAGEVQKWGDISQDFQAAWVDIEKAVKGVKGQSAASVSKVVLALTKQAVLEYDEALDEGRFVAEHEYQDGRGFVLAARDYLESQQATLKKKNKEAWRDAVKALEKMQKAWPTAVPPEQPVIPVPNLYAAQARLELALAPYLY